MRSCFRLIALAIQLFIYSLCSGQATFDLVEYQPEYSLNANVLLWPDPAKQLTPEQVLSAENQWRFSNPNELKEAIQTGQTYWGKITINNQLQDLEFANEWILSFGIEEISYIDLYLPQASGGWVVYPNGGFHGGVDTLNPSTKLNEFLVSIPATKERTFYFKLLDYTNLAEHQLDIRLFNPTYRIKQISYTRYLSIGVMGALLIMLLYNIILSYTLKERIYLTYSIYLLCMLIYTYHASISYPINHLERWMFGAHPEYRLYIRLNYYFVIISYLSFIISFLNLKEILPRWHSLFKGVIVIGIFSFFIDAYFLTFYNFNLSYSNKTIGIYLLGTASCIVAFLFPLYRSKSPKRWYLIGGVLCMSIGVYISAVNLINGNFTPMNLFYIQLGVLAEIGFFSAGLANQQKVLDEERSKAIRQKELEDFRIRMYTNITHELRNPLTIINGFSNELAQVQHLEIADKAARIHRNGQKMLSTVNKILLLRKMESGAFLSKKETGDLAYFVRHIVDSYESLADIKSIQILYKCTPKQIFMLFNEEHIQQILTNLLSNAIKFTPEGGKVSVNLHWLEKTAEIVLQVKDTGVGIPADQLEKIFERFYQLSNQHISNQQGSGIGLTIVKELIEKHLEGTIQVESELGFGTQFMIVLPYIKPPNEVIAEQTSFKKLILSEPELKKKVESAEIPTPASDLPLILIVEDNPDLTQYLKVTLQVNYQIILASDGAQGFDQAVQHLPDIIISDLVMPKMDGHELCMKIKSTPTTNHIPVILLTGRDDVEDRIKGSNAGAEAHISKPFVKSELFSRINQLRTNQIRLQNKYSNSGLPLLKKAAADNQEDQTFIEQINEIIENHYKNEDFDVGRLIELVPYSKSNLYRRIKNIINQTPHELIKNYRLTQAKELLEHTKLTIQEVAFQVGYKDHSHFTRLYQKAFGKLPKDSRVSHVE